MKASPYSGFDPLSAADTWEDRTRDLVLSRISDVPALAFFSEREARLLDAMVDRLVPQQDRAPSQRIPITPWIDHMLATDDTDGFRKGGMPWDQEVWRQVLVGVDQTSRAQHDRDFLDLDPAEQDRVLAAVQSGEAEGEVWQQLQSDAAFDKVVQEVVSVYYAHPSAWAEIGWPGPASKRGYMRTGYGQIDPWQPRETAEASSVSLVQGFGHGGEPLRLRRADALMAHDEVDAVVVGVGAAGAVLVRKLSDAGWRVVGLDAGPHWDPQSDFLPDERSMTKLFWRDRRVGTGNDPIELAANVTGKAVGGSTTHYSMYALRLHRSGFETATRDGVGSDWPLSYDDLEPYYDEVERELGIAGRRMTPRDHGTIIQGRWPSAASRCSPPTAAPRPPSRISPSPCWSS